MSPVMHPPGIEDELEHVEDQLEATDRRKLHARQGALQKALIEREAGVAQERHAAAKAYKDAEAELLARRDGLVALIKDAAAAVEEYHTARAAYSAARRRVDRTSLRGKLGPRVETLGVLGAGRNEIRDHELSIARGKLRAALQGGL